MDNIKPILKEYREEIIRYIDALREDANNKFQEIIERMDIRSIKNLSKEKIAPEK
jgi:hypothetical protein